MLNLIPALLLLLAGSPFGPPSRDVVARIETTAPRTLVVQLARELERAGLSAARAALLVATCEDSKPTQTPIASASDTLRGESEQETTNPVAVSVRFRDGPIRGIESN